MTKKTVTEYQVRSYYGRLLHSFDTLEGVNNWMERAIRASTLKVIKVTTHTEEEEIEYGLV